MPRPKLARRFEPRYGVNQAAIEVEAKYVLRELEDHRMLALSAIDSKRIEMLAHCKQSWEHVQLLVEGLAEQDQKILDALLFRDFYHILELYLTSIRIAFPQALAPAKPTRKPPPPDRSPFNEWLFDPN